MKSFSTTKIKLTSKKKEKQKKREQGSRNINMTRLPIFPIVVWMCGFGGEATNHPSRNEKGNLCCCVSTLFSLFKSGDV
jgi:hypothetical protein